MNKEDAPPNQIRYAYFGDSLRIVYEVTPDVDEEIQDVLRAEVFSELVNSKSGWLPITIGLDVMLCLLNADFKEAIKESLFIMTDDEQVIRDKRVINILVNP